MLALALAAAIVQVIAVAVVTGHGPGKGEVETVDERTTTTSPPGPTHALTFETSDYTLEAYFVADMREGWIGVDVYRSGEDLPEFDFQRPKNDAPPADGNCVDAGGTRELDYLYMPDHIFASGLVGPGISRIDVVAADGSRARAVIGSQAPHHDVRVWLAEIALADVDRVEGFDAAGDLVSSPMSSYGDNPALSC